MPSESPLSQQALLDRLQLLEGLFHSSNAVKLLVDPDSGAILEANPAAAEFYGYSDDELRKLHVWELSETPREVLLAHISRGDAGPAYFERMHRLKNGERRNVGIQAGTVELTGRRVRTVIVHDITDRVRAEAELRDSRARLEAIFHGARDAMLVAGEDGRIIDANAQAERLLGRSREAIIGIYHTELYPPEDRAAAERRFAERFNTPSRVSERRIMRPDGTVVPVELLGNRVEWRKGQTVQVGTFRDISERVAAEAELRKLHQVIEQSPVVVVITNPAGTMEYVNPRFTELTGYSAEEARGQSAEILRSGQTPRSTITEMWSTIRAGRVWRGEFCNKKKSGQMYWESAVISALHDARGEIAHYVAVKEDISGRKQLEEELRQAQKMEAIGQLAGGVAHDFNNILAAQLMNLSLLRGEPSLPPEVLETLKDIETGAKMAADLTRQLLTFSRRQVLQVERLEVNRLLGALLKMLRRMLGENIDLLYRPSEEELWVDGDPGMLEQVLMNLVVNARDALPRGGKIEIAWSRVMVSPEEALLHPDARPGAFACLRVTDDGCGMDHATLSRIFEPFFTTKAPSKGTGLGLATVYGIVRQHQGWIEVESQPGRGTTFRSYWTHAEARLSIAAPPRSSVAAIHSTVLLVEDELPVRLAIARVLRRLGHTVLEARDADEALQQWTIHRAEIDLLISDMVMPGSLNGVELAERIHQDRPELKVVICSGYNPELTRPGTAPPKNLSYLSKPFEVEQLIQAVRAVLPPDPARS